MLKINELNFAEPQIRDLVRLIPAAVSVVDNEMRYLATSDRWLSDYKLEDTSILGRSHYEVFPEIPERWKELHQRCLVGETLKCDEDSFERSDGQTEWVRWELVPWSSSDGTVGGMIMYTEVITEERQAAQVLHEEVDRAERYLDISGAMILSLNRDGRVTQINESGCKVLGCGPAEIVGRDWFSTFIPSTYQDKARAHFEATMTTPFEGIKILESPLAVRSGAVRSVTWRISVVHGPDGKPIGVICSGEDITEKREREQQLLALSRRNETILNAAGDGIYGLDRNGLATFINPVAARILGYDAGVLLGQPLHDFIHHTNPDGTAMPEDASRIHKAASEGTHQNVTDEIFWRSDGTSFPVEYTVTPVFEHGAVNGAVVVFRDVTEQRSMQAQLVQSSKLATLGEMATGVAHELNQPLNVIRMAAANIARKMDKGEVDLDHIRGKLDRINAQTERATAIIDHMRIFGRPASGAPSALHIPDVINGTLGLIGEQLRLVNILVAIDLSADCQPVSGHAVQVEQVFLNLLSNARDVLSEKPPGEERKIHLAALPTDDGKLRVSIADNGGGIEQGALDRIFEPFYTTKEVGKGTGLGLSISYGIIIDMGGSITAENDGEGARFTIEFPIQSASQGDRTS